MTESICNFSNTWWKQIKSTAKGTHCSCVYAMNFFTWHEDVFIYLKYKRSVYTIPIDFTNFMQLLYDRLKQVGYHKKNLQLVFDTSFKKLDTKLNKLYALYDTTETSNNVCEP